MAEDAVSGPADASTDLGGTTASGSSLGERLAAEIERLDRELAEIDLLIGQSTAEAARHEAKRSSVAEKLTGSPPSDPAGLTELANQVITLTKRAAIMEAQVEVLDGKRRSLARFRDALAGYLEAFDPAMAPVRSDAAETAGAGSAGGAGSARSADASASRLLLSAQEDLRREIARAIHDGPAQSLTNIVLQAQIVERIVGGSSPEAARAEVRQL